jgi:hypothetical protein
MNVYMGEVNKKFKNISSSILYAFDSDAFSLTVGNDAIN